MNNTQKPIKSNNYITIQAFMRNELQLKGNELLTYAIIYGFTQDGETEFKGSLNYIANWLGTARRETVINALNGLIAKGLITKTLTAGKTNAYKAFSSPQTSTESGQPLVRKADTTSTESGHNNYIYIDNNNNINKDKEIKHKHGEYKHVLLTDKELENLKAVFPDYLNRIRALDEYLENNKSKHYSNHLLTIKNWARKDQEKQGPKPGYCMQDNTGANDLSFLGGSHGGS